METWVWVVLALLVVAAIAIVVWASARARSSKQLRGGVAAGAGAIRGRARRGRTRRRPARGAGDGGPRLSRGGRLRAARRRSLGRLPGARRELPQGQQPLVGLRGRQRRHRGPPPGDGALPLALR